ncbi:MAG: hypothetical protein NWE98_07295 [Candidatus Bathyarchaeota archaeon]|nr:hypothetical protein [Candidatus Bathyarchaeota archaeon]
MKVQETKTAVKSVVELCDCKREFNGSMKCTAQDAASTQKICREGNQSKLISIGMAVFLFPEPTPISEIVGSGIMAVGAIQQGIKRQSIYAEDIPKTLRKTLKEIRETNLSFRF